MFMITSGAIGHSSKAIIVNHSKPMTLFNYFGNYPFVTIFNNSFFFFSAN